MFPNMPSSYMAKSKFGISREPIIFCKTAVSESPVPRKGSCIVKPLGDLEGRQPWRERVLAELAYLRAQS